MTLPAPQTRSIATHEILAGLARLHPFVLLADHNGRVEWMSPDLRMRLCQEPEVSALAAAGDQHLLEALIAHLPKPEQLDALRDGLVRNGRAGSVRLDLMLGHGAQLSIDASAFAIDSESSDERRRYVVIARPREGREKSEHELREAVGLLSQIVDSSPHGVIATDRSGYVTYANPRAAYLLGRSHELLVGSPIAVFLPKSDGFEDLLAKLREPTGWDGEEIERIDASGNSTWVSVSTRPLAAADGSPAGVVSYLRDITCRHKMQLALVRKNQELESYVDTVAHDLRSPLVSLLGFARLLQQDYEDTLDETGLRFLDRIEQAGRTMDALIHDLLELSRIGKPGEILALLDPRSVLLQLAAELKLRLEDRHVVLELPEEPPMLRVDGTRLYQVFSNLIGNALTHGFPNADVNDSDDSGEKPRPRRIRVEILEHADRHEIIVSDNGCGVPAEDHERIFEVLQTGRRVRRGDRAHGIGLAIVRKIATAYGGRVWLESGPDHGASFHLRLPRRRTRLPR